MTKEDIIELARQAGVRDDEHTFEFSQYKYLERFATLVAEHEREACAKVCDGLADIHAKMNQWDSHKTAETLAQAIRAGAIHD